MNNRRNLIVALGAGALAMPFSSFAQQQMKIWRVGFLASRHLDFVDSDYNYGPFRQGMRELGYVEGKNVIIEWRSAEGNNERLAGLASELVNLKMDAIVTAGSPATRAAQKATTTIPIVMGSIADPVANGFIASVAQPAGNITGLANMAVDVSPKQLEMLLDMVPKLSRVALLVNPSNSANVKGVDAVQAAGQKRGVKILRADARTPQEIDDAFAWIRQQNAGALMMWTEPFFLQQKTQIAQLAVKHRLPVMSGDRIYSEAGALMSYGTNIADQYRRAATYVGRILKGAKPADLPVEQPTKFELVINQNTAKALGLTIPQSMLLRADKVID
jgi:putative ABC transport system substrate-binding protein